MKRLLSPLTLLTLLTLLGAALRFTNLYWGQPYWFHPDERNIASAVTRLHWPDHMDPDFYAYGTVPIYLNFFIVKILQTIFGLTEDPFFIAIKVGRWMSALLSTALIPIMYWFANRYLTSPLSSPIRRGNAFSLQEKVGMRSLQRSGIGLLAALLTTFTTGFIQFAHFGTFEIWLTVLRLLLLVTAIEVARTGAWKWIFAAGILFGLAIGTKITSVILLPALALALLWHFKLGTTFRFTKSSINLILIRLIGLICQLAVIIITATLIFISTNPYTLNPKPSPLNLSTLSPIPDILSLLNPDFLHSINVEGGIARGTVETFYTRHFTGTIPGLYQLTRVYPWILSWPALILGLIGIIWLFIKSTLLTKNESHFLATSYQLLATFFLLQFAFKSTLFVKWTRYPVPTLPYLILGASLVLGWILGFIKTKKTKNQKTKIPLNIFLSFCLSVFLSAILWHTLQGLSFTTTYLQYDPRITAAQWASSLYSSDTPMLSEVWDMGIVPFNNHFNNIDLFNFYELDDSNLREERLQDLHQRLDRTQIFIIPSRRIWKHVLDHPDQFPEAANFYHQLFFGELGFAKVAEFSNAPIFALWQWPDEILAEETFSVFDHPRVQIWEKSKKF